MTHVRNLPLLVLAAALAGGCGTVAPRPVAATAIAIGDNGTANAGILGEDQAGFTVDAGFAAHYRQLCRKYRGAQNSVVPPGAGLLVLPSGGYWIDRRHLLDFLVMRAKERANLKGDR